MQEQVSTEIEQALDTIRRFVNGRTWLYEQAVGAYRLCMDLGIPVDRHIELLFMSEVDCRSPDMMKRKLYRLRLLGVRMIKKIMREKAKDAALRES